MPVCEKHGSDRFVAGQNGPECWDCQEERVDVAMKKLYYANDRQVGGNHYKGPIQHWDFAASNDLDYFQGQITKYVTRWKKKNGLEDLKKAQHFLEKYIELNTPKG